MNNKKFKVIISDVNSRKGYDIVNIIKRKYDYECVLCASKDISFQLPLIYFQKIFNLDSDNYISFKQSFEIILQLNKGYDLVYIPVSENLTRYFIQFVSESTKHNLFYLLPNLTEFNLCSDKYSFQLFCEVNKFPVPKLFTKQRALNKEAIFHPLIAKPRSGQGSVGIKHIDTKENLELLDHIDWDTYLVQEKIQSSNKVAGAFFLCDKGKVINAYCHQRLRTFPENGGVTVYSKSVIIKDIITIGTELLQKLEWSGLAMVEFMFDENRKCWKIIELNPRTWGSILLSEFNNSALLNDYIKLSLSLKINNNKKSIKENYIRWLFPFDLFIMLKGGLKMKDFFNFNFKNTGYINFTYGNVISNIMYLIYFTFNFSSMKRFILKLRG